MFLQFDLGCDEWRRTLIGSIRTFGSLFTQIFTGFISDRFGRRTALVFNAFNCGWLGVLKYFAGSYISFTILEFAQATLGGGTFQCAYILSKYVSHFVVIFLLFSNEYTTVILNLFSVRNSWFKIPSANWCFHEYRIISRISYTGSRCLVSA